MLLIMVMGLLCQSSKTTSLRIEGNSEDTKYIIKMRPGHLPRRPYLLHFIRLELSDWNDQLSLVCLHSLSGLVGGCRLGRNRGCR